MRTKHHFATVLTKITHAYLPSLQLYCVPVITGYEYFTALCIPSKNEVAFLPTPNTQPCVSNPNFESERSLSEEPSQRTGLVLMSDSTILLETINFIFQFLFETSISNSNPKKAFTSL